MALWSTECGDSWINRPPAWRLGVGIFNGGGILLKNIDVKGMVFGQQVEEVRLEHCIIGGSETTGVAFADSNAMLKGNFIHDNDHGVTIGGKSSVALEQNVITRSLFEAVMVSDTATSTLLRTLSQGMEAVWPFTIQRKGRRMGILLFRANWDFCSLRRVVRLCLSTSCMEMLQTIDWTEGLRTLCRIEEESPTCMCHPHL